MFLEHRTDISSPGKNRKHQNFWECYISVMVYKDAAKSSISHLLSREAFFLAWSSLGRRVQGVYSQKQKHKAPFFQSYLSCRGTQQQLWKRLWKSFCLTGTRLCKWNLTMTRTMSSRLEDLLRWNRLTPCVKTAPVKKTRYVVLQRTPFCVHTGPTS